MERDTAMLIMDETAKSGEKYPDVSFNVEGVHLFPAEGEIFEITDKTRLARTLNMLGEAYPELATTPEEREKLMQAKKNYLAGKITNRHRKQLVRKDIVDVDYCYRETIKLLMTVNHPATQLLRQIDNYHNIEHGHDSEMLRLVQNVATVVAWDQLRGILDYQIKAHVDEQSSGRVGAIAIDSILKTSDSSAA